MWKKNVYLLLIISAFYANLMINYPSELLKSLGYNQALNLYADLVSSNSSYRVLYDPGLRKIDNAQQEIRIEALLPGDYNDYGRKIDKLLKEKTTAIVECSAADTWHTSKAGQHYLSKMRPQAYRVVVFDGGHHLPTLGLAPDIIIVPEIGGFAVHSYMLDGIQTSKIQALAREINSPSLIVCVPRWALVKNEKALQILTRKIISTAHYTNNEALPNSFQANTVDRMSKYNSVVLAWVNTGYQQNISLFKDRVHSMHSGDIKKIYLAFDYADINREEAQAFSAVISKEFKVPVETVNQAVKVSSVFWGGNNVLP